jgi:pheromone shutdown protein TraB
MSETMKMNLSKCLTTLTIAMALATIVGAAYIGYDNAKSAKAEIAALSVRTTTLEIDYARFKGIMEERTQNIQTNVKAIYDIVKEWQPETPVFKGTTNE